RKERYDGANRQQEHVHGVEAVPAWRK
ncbi:hypothetical protein L195_g050854, partial [Trifolium pratense]